MKHICIYMLFRSLNGELINIKYTNNLQFYFLILTKIYNIKINNPQLDKIKNII